MRRRLIVFQDSETNWLVQYLFLGRRIRTYVYLGIGLCHLNSIKLNIFILMRGCGYNFHLYFSVSSPYNFEYRVYANGYKEISIKNHYAVWAQNDHGSRRALKPQSSSLRSTHRHVVHCVSQATVLPLMS